MAQVYYNLDSGLLGQDTVNLVVVTDILEEPAASTFSEQVTSTMKVVTLCSQGNSGNHV